MTEAGTDQACILLVDDNTMVRCAVEEYLSHIGFHVIAAADGKMALDIFARNRKRIGLIITDIFMPVLDGIALARRIRQMDKDIPMMAITGSSNHAIHHALDRLGVPLFTKPLDFQIFEDHLASVLGCAA